MSRQSVLDKREQGGLQRRRMVIILPMLNALVVCKVARLLPSIQRPGGRPDAWRRRQGRARKRRRPRRELAAAGNVWAFEGLEAGKPLGSPVGTATASIFTRVFNGQLAHIVWATRDPFLTVLGAQMASPDAQKCIWRCTKC